MTEDRATYTTENHTRKDEDMTPLYFDRLGVVQTETWAVDTYGVQFKDAGPGRKFALTEVRETEGAAVVQVNVFNEHGGPQYGQPVAQSWPTLDQPAGELPKCLGSNTCWSERCMHMLTDASGLAGFGFGGGAVIGGDGGPLSFWVLSPTLKSDGLAKVGWDGSTNHRGMLHLVFRIVDDGTDPEPPEPETGQRQRVLGKAEAVADARVAANPDDTDAAGIYLGIAEAL